MISLRRSRSHPLARFAACVLVPAIVLVAIPTTAEPSLLGQNPSYPIQDELYRLTSDTVTIGALNQYSKGFTYDDVGNRQTQTTAIGPAGSSGGALVAGTLTYGYDNRDGLTTETLDANPATTYGWDVDGNLISKSGEATYEWDREMRMVRVTKTGGTIVEHVYDFDGNRVQTTTTPAGGSAGITNYLVDTSGSLSHVVAETNATGGLVAHYVRGDDLLAVMRPNGSGGWASRFYHADHIGSVRRLTDETGVITDWYVYDAFGTLLGRGGTDVQPYAFTGEPCDPNVGFQYHRARWMDPRVGRFIGADPWFGDTGEPLTLHRYSYGRNDPQSYVDPSGRFFTAASALTGLSMTNTVAAISSLVPASAMQAASFIELVPIWIRSRPGPTRVTWIPSWEGWKEADWADQLALARNVWASYGVTVYARPLSWRGPQIVDDPNVPATNPSAFDSLLAANGVGPGSPQNRVGVVLALSIQGTGTAGATVQEGGMGGQDQTDPRKRAAIILSGAHSKSLTLAHELGHVLGLKDRWDLPGFLMYGFAPFSYGSSLTTSELSTAKHGSELATAASRRAHAWTRRASSSPASRKIVSHCGVADSCRVSRGRQRAGRNLRIGDEGHAVWR